MLASELVKALVEHIDKKGDTDVAVSVAFSNKLATAYDEIELVDYGTHVDLRAKQ